MFTKLNKANTNGDQALYTDDLIKLILKNNDLNKVNTKIKDNVK